MGVILQQGSTKKSDWCTPHPHGGDSWIEPVYINADSVLPILMGVITSRLSMAE